MARLIDPIDQRYSAMQVRPSCLNHVIQYGFRCMSCILLSSITLPMNVMAEEDPYLSAISSEASKVDSSEQPTLEAPGAKPAMDEGGIDLQAFEEDLKASYQGSYTFYQKLPRRTREEVFQVYSDGASIDEVRKMIMDRFLHQ